MTTSSKLHRKAYRAAVRRLREENEERFRELLTHERIRLGLMEYPGQVSIDEEVFGGQGT